MTSAAELELFADEWALQRLGHLGRKALVTI
jgi:hypothetical protein